MATVLLIRTAGTNCDRELARAFELAGAAVRTVHLHDLLADQTPIGQCEIIALPGGFSYGDDIASGRIFAMHVRETLCPSLRSAAGRGALVLGVCNGFQVLVQAGLLPGVPSDAAGAGAPRASVALAENIDGRFVDDWSHVDAEPESVCVWTRGLDGVRRELGDDALMLPSAHGEGRVVLASRAMLNELGRSGQIALRYREDFNGSEDAIAGLCDPSGRVFGLMPHPERFLQWTHHPWWTRLDRARFGLPTPGLLIFQNAVAAADELAGGSCTHTPTRRATPASSC